MAKTISAADAARGVTVGLEPVVDFHVTGAHNSRQDPPVKTRMPPKLETALGINQPWPAGLKQP